MAGFEIVVRPAIFPGIRPAPARALAPEDDPDKGICEIKGTGSHPVNLSFSRSASTSESRPKEIQRRVDTKRVYQQNEDRSINRDNFVDIEVANKIWMNRGDDGANGKDPIESWHFIRPKDTDNIETIDSDKIIKD